MPRRTHAPLRRRGCGPGVDAWKGQGQLWPLEAQPFQHGYLCASSLAVEMCLPF